MEWIVHDEAALDLAKAAFGGDDIPFGSERPFPTDLMNTHRRMKDCAPAQRRRIFCKNPDGSA